MYSIGSSIVMMWERRVWLMLSSMAASVVDLPLPVGPVTRIRPFWRVVKSRTTGGRPSRSSAMISNGIWRIATEITPRCRKTLHRNRDSPLTPNEKSSSLVVSKRLR